VRISYLVTFTHPESTARIAANDYREIFEVIKRTPSIARARLYTPESARDYYTDDGPSPIFAFQLDFETLDQLEATIAAQGHLQALANGSWPSLAGCSVIQQVMARRPFPVVDPGPALSADDEQCSFLVHYPGSASDLDTWLNYYLTHHPQIMKDFPGVREIEIFTRVDWLDAMPWRRVHYMQRNKLVFDSAAAITAAMNSPVRHAMRADFEQFPPFTGENVHHPMATRTWLPA
jgi:uncharacterized protein (TIGR02118 family)